MKLRLQIAMPMFLQLAEQVKFIRLAPLFATVLQATGHAAAECGAVLLHAVLIKHAAADLAVLRAAAVVVAVARPLLQTPQVQLQKKHLPSQ